MQGGRDPFFGFGDPFGSFEGFGGFGGQRSPLSRFFGGMNPFDDPFFSRPMGSMFNSSFFGSVGGPFMNPHPTIEHQPPQRELPRGPIIEELDSDDEIDEKAKGKEAKKENPRKHGRSSEEPIVEDPDDETNGKKSRHVLHSHGNNVNSQMFHTLSHPQTQSFTFQSSTVSYGGANGAYYSSSRTRRTGSDGFTFEECKEADSSTRQASHRISRGIHDKGHSLSRKLKSDGNVETMQTLHNLHEDEVGGFEEAWNGNARNFLPGWNQGYVTQHIAGRGSGGQQSANMGGRLALPSSSSIERSNNVGGMNQDGGNNRSGHYGRLKSDAGGIVGSSSRVNSNVGSSNLNNPSKKR